MSKFRAAALSAAAVIGFAVYAGAQAPAKQDSTLRRGDRQGQMRQRGERGERGEFGRGGHGRRGFAGGHGEGRLMKDLNLTDAQKSTIKSIHQKYRPQFEALRKQNEPQFKAMRDARQKDGKLSDADRAKFRTQMEQFRTRADALRRQEQSEVRAVLTAEQRAKWDAAAKQREARQADMKKRFENRRSGKA